ncbi:MAG TPA: FAD-dependent oxidoreductase [Candidatus Anammoximicrobium sp.]|nr:FAD-dependent oxidoreductase [Candidatus Anammoximicrobium sp.]
MPTITIDDRPIDVPPEATVLDAARKLGIDIPTLCFLEGYKASTSCQVCVVKLLDSGRVVPACGTRVVDGMRVASETPEVHRLRRTALELLLSDHVGDCLAPCFFACPAHMDVPQMLRQIGDEDHRSAIATIKEDIALPAILGRVCPKPCEKGCRRQGADGPVEVCELKRYVADRDLASREPYLPACRPASGRRVAVIGAGPTGLAAAFHLRREGQAVTVFDAQTQPGGRLHHEFSEAELPRKTLAAEVGVIFRLGVELRSGTRVGREIPFDDLIAQYDAVLVACGAVDKAEIRAWGLAVGSRGVEVRAGTYETNIKGVFAAGSATRGKCLVVRSVADGKEAAAAMAQFLAGKPITPVQRPFSSRMGKIQAEEMPEFLARAADLPRRDDSSYAVDAISAHAAADQAHRCLGCGCPAHGNCRLEHYAAMYGADPGRYRDARRAFVVVNRGGSVQYEPGKCINCELCIQIAGESQEALGLTFVGRGFDVRVGVPFQGTMEQALGPLAAKCVAACPTGALYFSQVRDFVPLQDLSHPRSVSKRP